MDISRKTDYAVRMLLELVRCEGEIVSVRQAAERNSVPYSFARSIQHDLVKAGIVESVRGSRGGMRLAVDPRETTLCYIVEAIQGPISLQAADEVDSADEKLSTIAFIWREGEALLRDYLDAVTLYDVVIEDRVPLLAHGHDFISVTAEERVAREG